ncbi:MAG: tetratricopeptide repeat protein [Bacteroidia bacterium]|nr:tetratricopeptide repeat protein [Bacteroidia bacterium]
MKKLSLNQWLVIGGCALITAILYIAPRKVQSTNLQTEVAAAPPEAISLEKSYTTVRDSIFKIINPNLTEKHQSLLNLNEPERYDSLFAFFKTLKQPFLAAYWAGKIADKSPQFTNLAQAGKFFNIGFEFAPNAEIKHLASEQAIYYYEKALKSNPNSTETKIELAGSYLEGGADPMKGVEILKEVLQNDSNNVAAQFKMGIFAVRSQQLDKAIARFKKVLVIEPGNTEALLYLGECYANTGNKIEALKALERFKILSSDAIINAEVDEFIEKLKQS